MSTNNVSHPSHYTHGDMECIDAIKGMLGDSFPAYVKGNVLKYIWRSDFKGGDEDLRKARQYLDFLIDDEPKGFQFPEIKLNSTVEYLLSIKLMEELGEVYDAYRNWRIMGDSEHLKHLLIELTDLQHVCETTKRKLGVTDEFNLKLIDEVIDKNGKRGYYGKA